jgi:hypothetical protein
VITNSYGDDGGDLLDSADDRQSTENIPLMADATGISVMFSSGDSGDEFTTVGAVAADYPASSPYATAVGGTTLQIGSAGQRVGEFGWSTGRAWYCNGTAASAAVGICTSDQLGTWLPVDPTLPSGGGGGGTSVVYPQPAWHQGVVPAALSERNGSAPMRVEPDISMEGDPATGMLVGETQTFPEGVHYDQYRIGGTSVASPLMAGVVARADQLAGRSLGFLNPKLYAQYGSTAALDDISGTHQVMSRSDFANALDSSDGFLYSSRVIDYQGQEEFCDPTTNQCSARQVALSATPGYDSMTGLGSPGPSFVPALSQRWRERGLEAGRARRVRPCAIPATSLPLLGPGVTLPGRVGRGPCPVMARQSQPRCVRSPPTIGQVELTCPQRETSNSRRASADFGQYSPLESSLVVQALLGSSSH